MKTTTIITILAMTTTLAADSFAAEFQTDTFKTKGGKEVVIIAIKHASLRIQYDGLEIQVDPVANFAPATDYAKRPSSAPLNSSPTHPSTSASAITSDQQHDLPAMRTLGELGLF